MNKAKLLIILVTFFSCNESFAQNKKHEPFKAAATFKTHMMDHPIKGCPTNSICSKELSKLRRDWLKLLVKKSPANSLERFRLKHGMPLKVWVKYMEKAQPKLIVWDSYCENHKLSQKIYIAEAWYKSFADIKKEKNEKVFIQKIYLLNKNQVTSYLSPRRESPLFMHGDEFYYTLEYESLYFGLWLGQKGKVRIAETETPVNFPEETACPKLLTMAIEAQKTFKNLYKGHFCKSIWDRKSKSFKTIAVNWSCH